MNFDRAVYNTLNTVTSFGSRIYPLDFAQPDGTMPTWPACRYTIVSSTPPTALCGSGDGDLDDVRVQVDIVAETYDQCRTLRQSVIDAMENVVVTSPESALPAIREVDSIEFDSFTKTYRAIVQFALFPSSEA